MGWDTDLNFETVFQDGMVGNEHSNLDQGSGDGLWLQNNLDEFNRKGTNPYEKTRAMAKHEQAMADRKRLTQAEVLRCTNKVNFHVNPVNKGNLRRKRFVQNPSIQKSNARLDVNHVSKYDNLQRIIRSKYLNTLSKDRPTQNSFSYQQDKYSFTAR